MVVARAKSMNEAMAPTNYELHQRNESIRTKVRKLSSEASKSRTGAMVPSLETARVPYLQGIPAGDTIHQPHQCAPLPVTTCGIVRSIIFKSNSSDHWSMYSRSSFIQVSKSSMSRPETAQRHVRPGRMRRRRRCHA